jgi:nitrogen fixation protein FixH
MLNPIRKLGDISELVFDNRWILLCVLLFFGMIIAAEIFAAYIFTR